MENREYLTRYVLGTVFFLPAAEAGGAPYGRCTGPAATWLAVETPAAARSETASGLGLHTSVSGIGATAASVTAESADLNFGTEPATSRGCSEFAAATADNMGDVRPGIGAEGNGARVGAASSTGSVPVDFESGFEAVVVGIGR